MTDTSYCQSCGMPISGSQLQGTESDGSLTGEFCCYCYQQGGFVQNDLTMAQMIEVCLPHMQKAGMEETEARALLEKTLPRLSRWKDGSS